MEHGAELRLDLFIRQTAEDRIEGRIEIPADPREAGARAERDGRDFSGWLGLVGALEDVLHAAVCGDRSGENARGVARRPQDTGVRDD